MIADKSRPAPLRSARPSPGIRRILVAKRAGAPTRGKLVVGGSVIPCALGRGGLTRRKREGDGATPTGRFTLLALWRRADRTAPLRTSFPGRVIRPRDGWCDDPALPAYNRPIRLPAQGSHETLWRADHLYDLIVTLDYNVRHPRKGRGSAIFFHVAHENWEPTAGCVAIRAEAMRRLLPRLSHQAALVIRV